MMKLTAIEHVHQGVSEHVGQVAGGGQHLVVMSGIHLQNLGADCAPHGAYALAGPGVGLGERRQNHAASLVLYKLETQQSPDFAV